jgi:hypothetical protein
MTGAAFIIRRIVMVGNVHNGTLCDGKVAILEKERIFLPFEYLHIATDINRPLP